MRAETRSAILETARLLGYPANGNIEARRLVARRHGGRVRTGMIAVIAPRDFFADMPLPQLILQGIQSAASSHDYDVLVTAHKVATLPRLISGGLVDGVITFVNERDGCQFNHCEGLPVIGMMTYSPETARIEPDDVSGTRHAVEHLVELGHRRIAFIGVPQQANRTPTGRLDGYMYALESAAITFDESLVDLDLAGATEEEGRLGLMRLLRRRPDATAVVCVNDFVASGVIDAARIVGVSAPTQLSVIGFGNFIRKVAGDAILSSVFYDRHAMGRRAVELIEAAVNGDERAGSPGSREIFETKLIVGDTTGLAC